MQTVRKFIVCLDEQDDCGLKNVRIIDPDTLKLVSEAKCGAWRTFSHAIDVAFASAESEGAIP